jgi:hypothetical protein
MRRVLITRALTAALTTAALIAALTALASAHPFGGIPASDPPAAAASHQSTLTSDAMAARLATAKYATNLARAKADGYGIITKMIPTMGYHFLNPKVTKFDVRKPAILVYEHHGSKWQLGALEWVFPSMPAKAPLPGAKYGVFGAACHYVDGTFVFATSQSKCAAKSPQTGAKFNFWHPRLITLHFWVWYPNPAGIYSGLNPMVSGFNGG